jgi:hypothetical protein
MEDMKLETFTPHVNSKFLFKRESEAAEGVELELIEVMDLGSTPRHEQFSLLFRGASAPRIEQSIYSVEHGELGAFELFIVPVRVRGRQDGPFYEAIFNRTL